MASKPSPGSALIKNTNLTNSKSESRSSPQSDVETKVVTLPPVNTAYSNGSNPHTRRARLIFQKPSKIFPVGEGCDSCIINGMECVWKKGYTRCARCTRNGASSTTCWGKLLSNQTLETELQKEPDEQQQSVLEPTIEPRKDHFRDNRPILDHDMDQTIIVSSTNLKTYGRASTMKRPRSPSEPTETPSKRVKPSISGRASKSNTHNFFAHLPRKPKEDRMDSTPSKDPQKQLFKVKTSFKQVEDLIARLTDERDTALARLKRAQEERDHALEGEDVLKHELDRAIARNEKFSQDCSYFKPLKRLLDAINEYQIDLDDLCARALDSKGANLATICKDVEAGDHNHKSQNLESEQQATCSELERPSEPRHDQEKSLLSPLAPDPVHRAITMQNGSGGSAVGAQGADDTDSDDEDTILNYRAQRRRSCTARQVKLGFE